MPIDTNKESWALEEKNITALKGSQNKIMNPNEEEATEILNNATNLKKSFEQIKKAINESKTYIADTQLLINSSGKITIIDPLEILELHGEKKPENFINILNPIKPNPRCDDLLFFEKTIENAIAINELFASKMKESLSLIDTTTNSRILNEDENQEKSIKIKA